MLRIISEYPILFSSCMMPCVYLLHCSFGGSRQSPFPVFAASVKHIAIATACKSRSRRFFKLLFFCVIPLYPLPFLEGT